MRNVEIFTKTKRLWKFITKYVETKGRLQITSGCCTVIVATGQSSKNKLKYLNHVITTLYTRHTSKELNELCLISVMKISFLEFLCSIDRCIS